MVASNFEQAYRFTLVDEVGKDDDPDDAGGRTCDGITQKEYDAWCVIHSQLPSDVWNIDDATKKVIYFVNYWSPWCDRLPNAIDYLFYDMDVNSGTHEAALILQRCLGLTGQWLDGKIGMVTATTAVQYPDKEKLVNAICDEHERVYGLIIDAHPNDRKFLHGWENRIAHERKNALKMLKDPPLV
ncbi:MAG TPA: glycosyl hydrolase 108 family protein [Candidatus Acidoferrum sp.]